MENFNDSSVSKVESIPTEVVVESTTTFIDSGSTAREEFKVDRPMYSIASESALIADFLKRPVLIQTYDWTTGDAFNSTIVTIPVENYLNSSFDYYWSKIKGFGLMKGTAVFRVVLNAQPFQCGRLLARVIPSRGSMSTQWQNMMLGGGAASPWGFTQKTQQPCVEIDARDKAAEISLPFLAPVDWFRIQLPDFKWGSFDLSVMSVLATGGSGSGVLDCQLGVYMYFEDVEFAAPMTPQAKGGGKYKAIKFSTAEDAAMLNGTVSTGLSALGKAAGSLGTIPMLASIMRPLSWASSTAAGVASAFGYSKPSHDVVALPVSRQMLKHSATATGVNEDFPMGMDSRNEIKRLSNVSLRDEDEMSFNFLKRVNAWFFTYQWTTALGYGTQPTGFTGLLIDPSTFFNVGTVSFNGHTATMGYYCPFSYLSPYFSYWRGSIELTFKIPKTQFHTGRLEVTFTPTNLGAIVSVAPTSSQYSMRWILDLSLGDEFTVILPYLSEYNYLDVGTGSGVLTMKVLNPLKGPATVTNSLNIMAFARAGNDFEFACPKAISADSPLPTVFYPQLGEGRGSIVDAAIGSEPVESLTTTPAELSIGEEFTSINQLIKRTKYIMGPAVNIGLLVPGFNLWPWFTGVSTLNGTTGALQYFPNLGDAYQYVAPMYQFYRGSVNIVVDNARFFGAGTTPAVTGAIATLLPNSMDLTNNYLMNSFIPVNNIGTGWNSGFNGVAITDAGPCVQQFRVPYYCKTKCSLMDPTFTARGVKQPDESRPTTTLNVYFGHDTCALARSFSDDFQLSMFIGCPPVLIAYL